MSDPYHKAVHEGFMLCLAAGLNYPPRQEDIPHRTRAYASLLKARNIDPSTIVQRFTIWAAHNEAFPNAPQIANLRRSDYQIGVSPAHRLPNQGQPGDVPRLERKREHVLTPAGKLALKEMQGMLNGN